MEITEINIKNIKGFGEPIQTIKLDNSIKSKKVNILVAPNGWGKSSLTAAFDSLKIGKLNVSKENKYKQDETLNSEFSLTIDNTKYSANISKNEITTILNTHIIHCDIYPGSVHNNMGRYSTSKGYIGIKPIEIAKIPNKIKLFYKLSNEKITFGKNSKILNNMQLSFSDADFIKHFTDDVFENCKKLEGKRNQTVFLQIKNYINQETGTSDKIKNTIDNNVFSEINKNENYIYLKNIFCKDKSEIDSFTDILQILSFVKNNSKRDIKSYPKINDYNVLKQRINENLKSINTTWKNIECTEHKGILWVNFPNADIISNGQRDILTFTTHLQVFKSKIQKFQKYFLIIDEVFDYLDDANVLAAQYYLTELLRWADKNDIELTLALLTHLDPNYFRTYTFNKKIVNICYLKNVEAKASEKMKTFIAFRQSISKDKPNENLSLYNKLSKYCFHYYKDLPNFKDELIPYRRKNIQESWCDGNNLLNYLLEELNKYLAESKVYDPYAVSLAIRIGTEKKVIDQLKTDEDKMQFMETHKTNDKIEFAENINKNIIVPDAYFILSLIHGESDHIEYDEAHKKFNEKPVIYKLNNNVIKHMVAELFDYMPGIPVPLSKLH